jgi:hypothetical protein
MSNITSPKFEISLGGFNLTDKQAAELEQQLRKTALTFIAKMDTSGDLKKNLYEFKPTPEVDEKDEQGLLSNNFYKKWWAGGFFIRATKFNDFQGLGIRDSQGIAGIIQQVGYKL